MLMMIMMMRVGGGVDCRDSWRVQFLKELYVQFWIVTSKVYVGWVQFGYDFEQRYWLVHFLKVQPGYNFEQ